MRTNEMRRVGYPSHISESRLRLFGTEGSFGQMATASLDQTLPPVNAWTAARFTLPDIIAHESAKQGGLQLDVPDFGDAP